MNQSEMLRSTPLNPIKGCISSSFQVNSILFNTSSWKTDLMRTWRNISFRLLLTFSQLHKATYDDDCYGNQLTDSEEHLYVRCPGCVVAVYDADCHWNKLTNLIYKTCETRFYSIFAWTLMTFIFDECHHHDSVERCQTCPFPLGHQTRELLLPVPLFTSLVRWDRGSIQRCA